jgi:hypothetical protein
MKKNPEKQTYHFNVSRHNPITNPIEYHIDNPYILRDIQNRRTHYENNNTHRN